MTKLLPLLCLCLSSLKGVQLAVYFLWDSFIMPSFWLPDSFLCENGTIHHLQKLKILSLPSFFGPSSEQPVFLNAAEIMVVVSWIAVTFCLSPLQICPVYFSVSGLFFFFSSWSSVCGLPLPLLHRALATTTNSFPHPLSVIGSRLPCQLWTSDVRSLRLQGDLIAAEES